VTVTSMVPSMLHVLVRTRVTQAAVPTLRWVFVSAAPLPSQLARQFEEQSGLRLAHAWGLSEFTNFATVLPADAAEPVRSAMLFGREIPCVGYPLDGSDVSVVRLDGSQADPGELGELRVTGPSMSLGYHRKPDETGKAFRDGWLYSGDEGYYLVEAGTRYFFVTDRQRPDHPLRGKGQPDRRRGHHRGRSARTRGPDRVGRLSPPDLRRGGRPRCRHRGDRRDGGPAAEGHAGHAGALPPEGRPLGPTPVADLDANHAVPRPDRNRDRLARSVRAAQHTVAKQPTH
jgi:hypothetical protein